MLLGKTMTATVQACKRVARECIAMRVRLLNRVVTKLYDDCLRPSGLRTAQMNILVAVSLMKSASPSEIEHRLYLDKSTVSRNVGRMRRRGWLEVVPGKDGRSHHLQVTAQGAKLLRKVTGAWQQAQEQAGSLLGKEGIVALSRIETAIGDQRV
jgi:DNA-binding MarR family transcriptional regulator